MFGLLGLEFAGGISGVDTCGAWASEVGSGAMAKATADVETNAGSLHYGGKCAAFGRDDGFCGGEQATAKATAGSVDQALDRFFDSGGKSVTFAQDDNFV
jgi:hypothetical protein